MHSTNYVDDLGWDRDDMICMMKAGNYTDQCELFTAQAYKLIEADPDKYQPDPDHGEE